MYGRYNTFVENLVGVCRDGPEANGYCSVGVRGEGDIAVYAEGYEGVVRVGDGVGVGSSIWRSIGCCCWKEQIVSGWIEYGDEGTVLTHFCEK